MNQASISLVVLCRIKIDSVDFFINKLTNCLQMIDYKPRYKEIKIGYHNSKNEILVDILS